MAETKFVVFVVDSERFALEIESVDRILPEMPVTRIPRSPKALMGVFDLRGDTIPALDVRERLGFGKAESNGNFVVILTPYGRCALRVDEVDGIHSIGESQIELASHLLGAEQQEMIRAVAKVKDRLIVLLNVEQIVPKEMRKRLAA